MIGKENFFDCSNSDHGKYKLCKECIFGYKGLMNYYNCRLEEIVKQIIKIREENDD